MTPPTTTRHSKPPFRPGQSIRIIHRDRGTITATIQAVRLPSLEILITAGLWQYSIATATGPGAQIIINTTNPLYQISPA